MPTSTIDAAELLLMLQSFVLNMLDKGYIIKWKLNKCVVWDP